MLQKVCSSDKNASYYVASLFQVLAGSLFLALSAQIAIPLFPVPLTMQTFAVMLLGALFGKVKGTLSVIAYVVESMIGLPVLSGMVIEPLALFGLRGGYLFGFIVQAYLTGVFFEKYAKSSFSFTFLALFSISILQLGFGTLWLGNFIGINQALFMGFYPFIPGAIFKCLLLFPSAKVLKI